MRKVRFRLGGVLPSNSLVRPMSSAGPLAIQLDGSADQLGMGFFSCLTLPSITTDLWELQQLAQSARGGQTPPVKLQTHHVVLFRPTDPAQL